jgi:hypothetical protein
MQETEVSGLYQPMSLLRGYLPTLLRSAILLGKLYGLSATPIGSSCMTQGTDIFLEVFVEKARPVLFQVKVEKIASTPL